MVFGAVLSARAVDLSTRLSWRDSLLLASALKLGCTHFLTEDLGHVREVEGLTIRNPFPHSPAHILSA